MDETTFITTLVFVLLLVIVLLLVLIATASFYSERLARLEEENSRLRQLLQEEFLLDNGSMAAFNRMFSTACLHGFEDSSIVDEDV